MSSIAIGARQLKMHATQGRWVPGVFVVVAAAVVEAATVVAAATEEVVAVVVVLAAVVVFATDVVVSATVVVLATAVVLIVVVIVAVVVAAAVVLVVVFSWSLMLKQLWQSGLLTRRWSKLWWQRREIAIFATWSDHFVCHLDAWDCFFVVDLHGWAHDNFWP